MGPSSSYLDTPGQQPSHLPINPLITHLAHFPASIEGKPLSMLRGKLSPKVSIFIFKHLMLKYVERCRKNHLVRISDNLCLVQREGQIDVAGWRQIGVSKQFLVDFIQGLQQIVELVTNLCVKKEQLWARKVQKVKQKIACVVLRYNSNLKILKEKLQDQIIRCIQNEDYPIKVDWVFDRDHQESSKKDTSKHSQQFSAIVKSSSLSQMSLDSSVSMDSFQSVTSSVLNTRIKAQESFNKHELSLYQHSSFLSQEQNFSPSSFIQKRTIRSELEKSQKNKTKKSSARLYISPQFSFNILVASSEDLAASSEEKESQKSVQKSLQKSWVDKKSFKIQQRKLTSICQDIDNSVLVQQMFKRKANRKAFLKRISMGLESQGTQSVLRSMARFVEVRENPSQKKIMI